MAIVNKPLYQMLEEIELSKLVHYNIIIPERDITLVRNPKPSSFPTDTGEHYIYTESLNDYFDTIVGDICRGYRSGEDIGFPDPEFEIWEKRGKMSGGFYHCVALAFENAFLHGSRQVLYLPISIKTFRGEKGCVVRFQDSGKGFDIEDKLRRLRRGSEDFFIGGGAGLWHYDNDSVEVSFENKGNVVNIMKRYE